MVSFSGQVNHLTFCDARLFANFCHQLLVKEPIAQFLANELSDLVTSTAYLSRNRNNCHNLPPIL
jgi:hypothetical protein